jgi:hypothetical protein
MTLAMMTKLRRRHTNNMMMMTMMMMMGLIPVMVRTTVKDVMMTIDENDVIIITKNSRAPSPKVTLRLRCQ